MNVGLIVFVSLVSAPVFFGVAIHKQLVTLKSNTRKAWSNIDVLLKQRNNELPKLLEMCKQYMPVEKVALQNMINAQNLLAEAFKTRDRLEINSAETKLEASLRDVFFVAENYPELKVNRSFLRLQKRISALEESISDRREFYNDTVALNNTRLEQFPDNVIAKAFHFNKATHLQFHKEEFVEIDVAATIQN